MSIEEKQSYRLPWKIISDFVSGEISTILSHSIRCKAHPDDWDYWAVSLVDYKMPLNELMMLFDAVGADKETMRKEIPDDSNTVKELGMLLATGLLQRRLGYKWERVIAEGDALWLVGCSAAETFDIGDIRIPLDRLKSKNELMNWLVEYGATHTELMDFCEEYRNEYHNELCWNYPISDGRHLGTFLILVKEGIMSLPYDEANKEDYEVVDIGSARLFTTEAEMNDFISEWDSYADDLRLAMVAMSKYLHEKEKISWIRD